jgi:hypothetical protein
MKWPFGTGLFAVPFLLALALWLAVAGVGSRSASAAVTNNGFESGDLTGWATGTVTEEVTVVGTETIADGVTVSPLEGERMARLGTPQPSETESQSMGPNELSQDFTITENVLRFAYNIWTYDYTGYDEFRWEVRLSDTDTVIGSYQTQAWGNAFDVSRKSSGWQVVEIDTSAYQGRSASIFFSAAGTFDQLYAFWVYIDSADQALGTGVVDLGQITVNGFAPSQSSQTRTIFLTRPPGTGTNTIAVPIQCPDGSDPTGVDLIVAGGDYLQTYPMTKDGGTTWTVTFPTPPGDTGNTFTLTLRVDCDGMIISQNIGSLTLIDPSGFVTDAATTEPIPEATVTLQRLDAGVWADVNPFETAGDPPSPTSSPQVNPQLTDADGHYGWDVVAGTYRVIVEKEGYVTQTSPEVTVPPPVTDLNIQLVAGTTAETRTVQWAAGWQNGSWSGATTPTADALDCADGKYAAVYRFVEGGSLQRYFPGRPDISNLTDLNQYDAFLILITEAVSCELPVAAAPGASRTVQWTAGWFNDTWTGADGATPESAFACAGASVSAVYRFAEGGALERYFPGRADISNLTALDQYDTFLILLTGPVTCDMPIVGAPI